MKKLITTALILILFVLKSEAQCFTLAYEGNGVDQMNIYFSSVTVNGSNLEAGDEIGIFDGEICVGRVILTTELLGLPLIPGIASGDDQTTPGLIDGYIPGHAISYRLCIDGGTVVNNVQSSYSIGTGIFAIGATAVVSLTGTTSCVTPPTITLSSTSGTTCVDDPFTLSGNSFINANTITISENGAGSVSPSSVSLSPFSFTYTPDVTDAGTTVTISFTSDNPSGAPCVADIETFTLTVSPLPAAAGIISGTATVCQGALTVAYSVPAIANAASYTWAYSGSGATINGSTNSITINFAANATSGNLTVTGTNTCGNGTVSANYPIAVNATNTAGAPSSTPTLCINTALIPITHTTTGATGIGTPTNLPAGVTAAWSSNTITISGTPSAAGTFNYSIPLTGGCGTVYATGTITVTPLSTVSGPSATPTLCVNTVLPLITHTATGTNWITAASGLPEGVDVGFSSNVVSITGTPTTSGIFNYTVFLASDCGTLNATGTITVTPANTAGTASSTPTLCIGTALTPITHATTGATGIGAPTGLPSGVSANWAANTITISGTPTAAGTFNYSIPLTGGCGTVNATGTITVTPANTAGTASSTPTLCIGTALTPITHTTSGANGIGTPTNLPTGVSASWASNMITISGTPSSAGTFNYSIPLTGGCGTVNATGTITVRANNTVTAASSTPTLCINTPLTAITHTTTGATGIGTATGLPSGVLANWATNTITISGTPGAAGTFNYTIPLTGGCGTVNASGTITVNPANTVGTASSTPTLCINTPLTPITHTTSGANGIGTPTNLPAGVTASWASNTITISGTPTASGTFNYTIPLTGGCGTVNATGTITVTQSNTAGTASSTPTLCIGTALAAITHATTGATGIGAPTGLPSGVIAAWASNTITISGTPGVAGTFNYTIPLTGGCGTVNATGTITVRANNTVTAASSTPTLCISTPLTAITHTTTGATGIGTATGLPSGVSANWAANTITISGTPGAAGTFNYTIPLTGGCGTVNATGTITVTPANTAGTASSTPTLCIGTALTPITHTTSGANGIGTPTGLPSGVTAAWAANTITISGTPGAAGTFNYTIPLTGGCGSVNATGTITVTPANTAGTASSTPTLCNGTALTAITHATTGATGIGTATGLPSGVSANWATNTITISGTPGAAGTFNYTIPLTGGCGTVNATGTITVNPTNTVGTASSTPTLCINTPLTPITHTTSGANGIGTPTNLPAGVSASWASNTITISGTPSAAGTFSYSIPLTGGCGTVNATGTITVRANNTVTAASSAPTLCISTPLTAITHTTTGATGIGTATGLPAGVTAAWASNTITISGTPTASGTFNYSIPLTGGCGTVNATGTITVTPANTITLTSGVGTNNQTVCAGTAITSITYTTTGATGATVTGLPSGVTGNWSAGVVTISGTPSAAGVFGYTITLTGGCGVVTANGTINVNALPVTSVITGIATPACSATGVPYSVTSTSGSTYTWTVPAGATVATGQGTNSITVNFGTTNGNVAVTERNIADCYGTPRTLAISLQGCGLSADFSASPRSVCIGSTVEFTNLSTGTSGSTAYSWNFGVAANPLTATGPGPHFVTYGTASSKDVTLTITEGASDVETKLGYITVNPANTITLTSTVGTNNQTVCVNTAVTTITYSTTGATGATFSGFPSGLTVGWSSNVVTITGTPSVAGNFSYTITLTGGCGSVNATGNINVTPLNTVSAPSSTPTVCISALMAPVTHSTNGATGIGTPIGLPGGVSANWAANTITISGTPTASGTFNYSIPLTGGCGAVNATGTITVTPTNTVGPASSTPTLCIGTALTPITHATTGATGIGAPTGLPSGVSANWAANTITISGTPTASGTFNYSIPLTGGCGTVNATGTITVTPANTAGVASSTPTLCINTPLTPITHTTSGANGIGTPTNLPAGVTASWASNTITISGTPSAAGTFNYSIPLTGGCGTVNATGTITVRANNTVTAASSTPTLCISTPLTAITHTTTGVTGIGAATGLPSGVSANWATNTITISGTPGVAGTFNYTIPLTGGCGTVNATGTITVNPTNTVGTASSTPTLCINTPLTPITHTTTGATGIGTATGLPSGVSANWAANTITISGTPGAAGTFNYTIPLTGGCGTVNATGTITVTPANTAGTASSTPTLCIGTALTPITHTTSGANGIGTPTGLPSGVTAAWAANTITISGTPGAAGTFNYTIPLTGGCGSVNATGTITVTPANTAGTASSTPTLCNGTALTAITHATTGATGIGTATGLPSGVSANWAANTITISGTPTASGTFNYSIPLTGGCGTINATGTITVTPANTAGPASSTPTLCINTPLTPITHTTSGANGIGTPTNLPAGVSASWASNTITISGTPSAAGTFSYSIPLTGGCGTVNATGTITVRANNTVTAASSTPTLCISTPLTAITHTTTGATGIGTATGLPSGVSANWAANTITISGTPTASGTFNYTIPLTGGCGTVNATGTITVTPANTAGTASSTPTLCIGTALTPITHTTSGANGIGTPTGLPSGVTAAWAANTITISGTPGAAGTFNYTIPLTGGCGSVNATGTITVTPANTAGTASSTPTLCNGTALTAITHATTGATGIGTATGLPLGVTAAWASNTITISGTPTAAGIFNYTIPLTGGCGTVNATGTITVNPTNTVGTASSTPTLCINTPLTPITHTTSGANGIGIPTNLPTGVSASWASNTITISGTPSAAGTFNYSIPLTGGCGTVNATGTITVRANNTVTAASSTPTLCISTPLTAITHTTTGATGIGTATGLPAGVTAAWASNTITISGTPTASGIFNYSIPLTGGCGTLNATGTITVTPANTITLTSGVGTNNQTVCAGTAITSITYTTTGATGATVTGLPSGVTGNWSAGVVMISGTPSAAGAFGYTVTLTGGCGAVTANGTINVNALPVTSVITGTTTPACSAAGVPYSVTSTSGSTYTWTVPAGATVATGQGTNSITVNFGTTNGNVAVTERNTAGCNGTPRTLAISLQGCGLDANFSGNPLSICVGSSVTFTNTSTGTTGGTTYSWNFGSGATPATITGIGPHTVTYSTSGSKTVSLTITEGATNTETKNNYITVNPTNTINLTSGAGTNNQTVCVNTAVTTITYSTTGATGATFSGFPSGLTVGWSSNVVTITGTPSVAGNFSYTITLTGGCGSVNATGNINVTPLNTVSAPSSTPTVCISALMAPVTHSTTGATGIGTPIGLPSGVSANWATNSITISGTPGAAGTFNYTIPLTGGCGTVNATGSITVNPTNTVGTASSTPTLCINTPLTPITHTTSGANGIGIPTNLPAGVSASWASNTITISGTPSAAGTFNYSIPLTGGCGTVNATGTITVRANNTVTAASSTPTLCISTPLTAITHTTTEATGIGTATGLPAGVTAAWASNTITISGTPTASGIFNYSIPLTGGCGTINATGTITVTPANTITLTSGVGTNNQTVCAGTAITSITYTTTGATGATVTGLPSGVTGNWSAGVVMISGTPSAAGAFGYTVTLTGGCGAVTANGTINVNALPVTSVITGIATPACSAAGVPYSVTSTSGSTYTWTVPAGATVATGQGTNSITVNFGTTNGNVSVTERNTAGCNGTPRTLAISLQGCGLNANFSGTPLSICVGSSVTFTNTSTGTTGGTIYSWNFGSGATPATILGIGPHTVTYSTSGAKTVSLTITEGASDTETRTNYITVNPTNTINLTSGVGTNNQTVCVNTAITNITYSTTSATGASFSGLPPGVNANWASNAVTISGTPTTAGTYNYTVTLTGGCGNITANGTINVNICAKTLNLTLFLEGLYDGANGLIKVQNCVDGETPFDLFPGLVSDTLTVELAQTSSPYTTLFSQHGVPVNTNGTISLTSVPGGLSGNYHIVIKHRNHIETWSQATSFAGSTVNYNFTDAISKAWANNMVLTGSIYCIYGGDANRDQYVDGFDLAFTFNNNRLGSYGYQLPDINGDGFVDGFDLARVFNNNRKGVGMITPIAPLKKK